MPPRRTTGGAGQPDDELRLPVGLRGDAILSTLLRSSAEGLLLTRLDDATVIAASDAFVELTGYGRDELIGRPVTMHGLVAADVRAEYVRRLEERGSVREQAIELHRKDGGIRHVTFSMDLIRDGDEVYLLSLTHDVTDRVRAETELRSSQARFARLFESSPAGTLITRVADGIIVAANPACEQLLGYQAGELIGRSSADADLWADRRQRQQMLDLLMARGSVRNLETLVRTKGGGLRPLICSFELVDIEGELCLIAASYDVTEHKRIERELELANEAKSRLISHVSHELRTPLAAIIGFGELLQLRGELTSERDRGWVDHIVRGGHHLHELINELLDVSRLEAGKVTLSIEPVSIDPLLDDVHALMAPLAADAGITIERCRDAATGLVTHADTVRLKQVLLNLLSNAIKYNRPDGRVELCPYATARGTIRIAVRDTGAGLRPDQLARLFQPFERLGIEGVEGSGLGLVVSHGLVEAMRGTLTATSEIGVGSTFTVELPATTAPVPVEDAASGAAAAGGDVVRPSVNGRVLYVEDNSANVQLVETLLAQLRPGVRLTVARNGETGARLVLDDPPDLLLLDLDLPDISGEDLLRRVRGSAATAGLPVLMLSADSNPSSIQRVLAAGAQAYLTKPLHVPTLLEAIDGVLGPDAPPG